MKRDPSVHESAPVCEARSSGAPKASASWPVDASGAARVEPASDSQRESRGSRELRDLDWRALLCGASPREVLERLVAKDSLGIRARVAKALSEQCYLLDADRVHLRAVARVARFSTRYRGEPGLDAWLRSHIDDAILDGLGREDGSFDAPPAALRGDDEAPHAGDDEAPHAGERTSVFSELARPLGLDAERMRAACAALNARPSSERKAFFALVLDRRGLEEAARALGTTPSECGRAARRALDACMDAATGSELPAASRDDEGRDERRDERPEVLR